VSPQSSAVVLADRGGGCPAGPATGSAAQEGALDGEVVERDLVDLDPQARARRDADMSVLQDGRLGDDVAGVEARRRRDVARQREPGEGGERGVRGTA